MYCGYLNCPIGTLCLKANEHFLLSVSLTDETEEPENENSIIKEGKKQLQEYFDGKRRMFDLPLLYDGTPFRNDVLRTLAQIPYGATLSYGELAKMAKHEGACRAVGNAVHNNPCLIVIPCHRVVAGNGKPGGFAYGLKIKEELLKLEKTYERTAD